MAQGPEFSSYSIVPDDEYKPLDNLLSQGLLSYDTPVSYVVYKKPAPESNEYIIQLTRPTSLAVSLAEAEDILAKEGPDGLDEWLDTFPSVEAFLKNLTDLFAENRKHDTPPKASLYLDKTDSSEDYPNAHYVLVLRQRPAGIYLDVLEEDVDWAEEEFGVEEVDAAVAQSEMADMGFGELADLPVAVFELVYTDDGETDYEGKRFVRAIKLRPGYEFIEDAEALKAAEYIFKLVVRVLESSARD